MFYYSPSVRALSSGFSNGKILSATGPILRKPAKVKGPEVSRSGNHSYVLKIVQGISAHAYILLTSE
jgi:hypothetical protein